MTNPVEVEEKKGHDIKAEIFSWKTSIILLIYKLKNPKRHKIKTFGRP